MSTFVGTFLPASIGGDAVRAYSLSNHNVPIADSMASVVVDRMLGVLSVLLMALLGLALAHDLAASRAVVVALGLTALACVAAAVLIFSDTADRMAERADRAAARGSRPPRHSVAVRRHPAILDTPWRLGERAGELGRRASAASDSGVFSRDLHRDAAAAGHLLRIHPAHSV